jgi:hypothetical protein
VSRSPIERLKYLQRLAEHSGWSDDGQWLADVLERLAHGVPADTAFGLTGGSAKAERDQLLRAAARASGEASPWRQSGKILETLKRINSRRRPIAHCEFERLLIAAQRCAVIPCRRSIYDILRD